MFVAISVIVVAAAVASIWFDIRRTKRQHTDVIAAAEGARNAAVKAQVYFAGEVERLNAALGACSGEILIAKADFNEQMTAIRDGVSVRPIKEDIQAWLDDFKKKTTDGLSALNERLVALEIDAAPGKKKDRQPEPEEEPAGAWSRVRVRAEHGNNG